MFQEVIDQLMLMWYSQYTVNKERIEQDDEFNQSRERKKMDEFIEAIVLLYSNKRGRS
jgi:hypothetical protein